MNIENASKHIDEQEPSEDGAAEDELQMEQESEGEAVRQVGESSDWESESERLIRTVTDNAGQMG